MDIQHPPEFLDHGYEWLLGHADTGCNIEERIEVVRRAVVQSLMPTPGKRPNRPSAPVTTDHVAFYLLLVRAAMERPSNLDFVQASRVLPYISAIGANREVLGSVEGVGDRVRRWLSPAQKETPDSTLFELLVAACYSRQGWECQFLSESKSKKTPDLRGMREGAERWVECKRLRMRSDYSRDELLHWGRLWSPLRELMKERRHAFVIDIKFHRELRTYPTDYLVSRIVGKLRFIHTRSRVIDDEHVSVTCWPVDLERIARSLRANYTKVGTSSEVLLVTGEYRPEMRVSHAIAGRPVLRDEIYYGPAAFWDEIGFACAAFWSCDASAAVEKKARDVRKHLSEATSQLAGDVPASVHIGIETLDGALVEDHRYERILRTVANFDVSGSGIDWIYCHLFGPESPPNSMWDFAETTVFHGREVSPHPIGSRMLVIPDTNASAGGVHWRT